MPLNILAVGDIVASTGLKFLCQNLRKLRREKQIDFCVVNGENASIVGITPDQAERIFNAGADVITLGNHAFHQREIVPYLEDTPCLLRPANLAPQTPGKGFGVFEIQAGMQVAVINLIGRCNMDFGPDNPFLLAEKILQNLPTKLILVEFHAEATSEKLAMGYMLDGRVSAVWGTHTHVPTADNMVLPKGTGYVTDLGMTGPMYSVLGIRPELSYRKFCGDLPRRYEPAPGKCKLEGMLFCIDEKTGLALHTERIMIHD